MFRFPIDGNGKVVVSGEKARTTVVSGRYLYIIGVNGMPKKSEASAIGDTIYIYFGVNPFLLLAICSGVPVVSTLPPFRPPSGPMSMI